MINFDKIVNKLWKQENSIINIKDIWNIIDPDFSNWNKKHLSEIYKIIYRLKAWNIILPIKNWLYFVSNWKIFREIDIISDYYWQIVAKIVKVETNWNYIIAGNKALEIHLKDYSIQNNLIVYTKDVQKNIKISSEFNLIFKILSPWKKDFNKTYNFNYLKKFWIYREIDYQKFFVAWEELALLDSLLIQNSSRGLDNYLINKFLSKFEKYLSREKLWFLVKYRYISSINRLRVIAKNQKLEKLYLACLDIIKNEWANCFLSIK